MKRSVLISAGSLLALVFTAGCPPVQPLPDTFDVNVSAAEKQAAPRDSGPAGLADSSWAVFRKSDPNAPSDPAPAPGPYGGLLNGGTVLPRPPVDAQVFVVDFGAGGEMTAIHENQYFLTQYYGTEVPVGAAWSPTTLPLTSFRSASYGLQVGDRFGLAVVVQVQAGSVHIGRAVLYAWGTITSDDRLDGTFGYLLDFSEGIGDLLLDTGGDQYPIYATRR